MLARVGEGLGDFMAAFGHCPAHVHLVDGHARRAPGAREGVIDLAGQLRLLEAWGVSGLCVAGDHARAVSSAAGPHSGAGPLLAARKRLCAGARVSARARRVGLVLLSAVGYGMTPILLKFAYAEGAQMEQILYYRFLLAVLLLGGQLALQGRLRALPRGRWGTLALAAGVGARCLRASP